jgi:hypothetical protein
MDAKISWLIGFVGVYWIYCLFWGIKGAQKSKTSTDYFLAGRSINIWVFILAATATSFSGQYKNPNIYGSPREKIIGRRLGFLGTLDPPKKTIDPINSNETN